MLPVVIFHLRKTEGHTEKFYLEKLVKFFFEMKMHIFNKKNEIRFLEM